MSKPEAATPNLKSHPDTMFRRTGSRVAHRPTFSIGGMTAHATRVIHPGCNACRCTTENRSFVVKQGGASRDFEPSLRWTHFKSRRSKTSIATPRTAAV